MTCFSSFFAKLYQKMKKNTTWKFTDELSVTFQLSISGAGEFGLYLHTISNKLFPINFNSLTNIRVVLGVHISKGWGRGEASLKVTMEREIEGGWLHCGWEKKVKYVLITLRWISHIFFSASIHRKSIIPHVNFNYHDVL